MFLLCGVTVWSQSDITSVGILPISVAETSGLISYNSRLITHNDSGNDPVLYEFDAITLEILRTVTVEGAPNTDWEDITQDDDFIYIGDIGNNNGDRRDLNILSIAKSDYDSNDTVTATIINFSYEDQTDFTTMANSDFDAEALFALEDQLVVLTKQWQQLGTVAYRIPKVPGTHIAERFDFNQIDGLVTGATFDIESNTLFLVGYSSLLTPFFASFTGVQGDALFSGESLKTNLDIGFAQTEAITRTTDGQFFISSEAFSNPPLINSASQLFQFSLDEEVPDDPDDPDSGENPIEEGPEPEGLIVFKDFGGSLLNYNLNVEEPIVAMGIFDASGKLINYVPLEDLRSSPIDISYLSQSLYYLGFFFIDDRIIAAPFFKD